MNAILLVGGALVGLPILLHLIMKQEPKRLPFPAFRFLKQRLKTNQRKLRLRHFLLLALRMLLIALFCLALYQPSIMSDGLIPLHGEQPLAVVVVIDTTPGMGYADSEGRTRLEEACRRAVELINDLPPGSRVAIVETGDPGGAWLPSPSDARSRLDDLAKRARSSAQTGTAVGPAQPVTSAIATGYQLFRTVDEESDTAEPMPRLLAVFTDRAASSWDPARVEELKKLREAIPDPKPAHAVVDVGVDSPVNVAILAVELADGKSQVVPADQPVSVSVAVGVVGPEDLKVQVKATLDGAKPSIKEVEVPRNQTRSVGFEFRGLAPGLHQVEFELATKDALMCDNKRFLTFRTAEPRKILTIADDPAETTDWKRALDAFGAFTTEVIRPNQIKSEGGRAVVTRPDPADPTKSKNEDLQTYEAVCLFAVGNPTQPLDDPLWGKLLRYTEAGGKLIIIPGGSERMGDLSAYDPTTAGPNSLMPGTIRPDVISTRERFTAPKEPMGKDRRHGVIWSVFADADDRAFQHPLLAPIKEWHKKEPRLDLLLEPRKTRKYWDVEKRPEGTVITTYDDDDVPAKRHPAILERNIRDPKDTSPKGKVILLTTRMDNSTDAEQVWNDYWEGGNSWSVAFPELLVEYAAGSTAGANFNYLTGQTVTIPLAKLLGGKRENVVLDGPGVVTSDVIIRPSERQAEVRLGPPKTNTPGNFTLSGPNPDWKEGFSLNIPAEESTLDKAPVEGIEELTGPGSVVPVGKDLKLEEVLEKIGQLKTPVDLFPWLLIAVLLLLATEGLLANRFYRRPK